MANIWESAAALFGWGIVRRPDHTKQEQAQPSFTQKDSDDGSAVITASGNLGAYVDLDGTMRTEAELINKYREVSLIPDVDMAVNEIVNEVICVNEDDIVKVDLDDVPATDPVKEAITTCFEEILDLLEFNHKAYYIFHKFYVDGRLYYHAIIDETSPETIKKGLQELRYIDPRKIRKIREIERTVVNKPGYGPMPVVKVKAEYFMYNESGFNTQATANPSQHAIQGLKIAIDSIASITSGVTDATGQLILSYLHKAIKPVNVLRAVEDATVIYRLARAPERRVWYIDVGNLPKAKAEQYVKSMMDNHKNKLSYDVSTGQYQDQRKFMTMLEDYWLPRREGGKGTEVETLPSGQNLGEMADVEYFQRKLYMALNVPISRLQPGDAFSIGRATEITRDEVAFGKFVTRLRTRFGGLFTKLLEKQVVLKQIMSVEDFQKIASRIKYDFANDNYFMEMKEAEVLMNRMDLLERVSPWVGRYYSNDFVEHKVLRKNDQEVEEERAKIEEEEMDPIYSQPMPGAGNPMMDAMGGDMMNMGPDELPMGDDPEGPQGEQASGFGGDIQQKVGPVGQQASGSAAGKAGGNPFTRNKDGVDVPQQRREFKKKKQPKSSAKDK
jgi:hypothetical protein